MESKVSIEKLSLYGIERQKAIVTKREQESVNREGKTQETYGKKPNTGKMLIQMLERMR